MAESGYDIDYNDQKFKAVESDKQAALTEQEKAYDGMVSGADKYYQGQIDAAQDYANTQKDIQNQQTDFAIEQVRQQHLEAQKDYQREQSGAYTDWKEQSNQQGVRAEQLADRGLDRTGYSESAQVSMYNTYQNRVATARESYDKAVMNYNNAITQARLQNSSALAEIAYNALKTQLELSLQGFQYKNQLLLDKLTRKTQLEDTYYSRYQDVLKQMNTENALAEQVRQANATLGEQQRQFNYYHKLGEFSKKNGKSGGGGSGGGSGRQMTGIPALDYGVARSSGYQSTKGSDSPPVSSSSKLPTYTSGSHSGRSGHF